MCRTSIKTTRNKILLYCMPLRKNATNILDIASIEFHCCPRATYENTKPLHIETAPVYYYTHHIHMPYTLLLYTKP